MAAEAETKADGELRAEDHKAPEATSYKAEKVKRPLNAKVMGLFALVILGLAAAIFFAFYFVEEERERDLREWQIKLGIVADSRTAAINGWVDENFGHIRGLVENASLQLYMSDVTDVDQDDPEAVLNAEASQQFLRNLLIATAERTGFAAPEDGLDEVAANVERVGVAGMGIVDANGVPLVSTPGMPPISGKLREAAVRALSGEPALIDIYKGATNQPTIGFALPVYGIQSDGSEGIGAIIGIRIVDETLFERLKQPGEIAETAETFLARLQGNQVDYLSPLRDGTGPLERSIAHDPEGLAASFAIDKPGGFSIRRDYAGNDALVTSRALAGVPWVLVRKVDRAEALSGTETRLRTILIVFVLMIAGVAITIFAVWRHGSSLRATEAAENFRVAAERFSNLSKFMKLVTNSQPTEIIAVDGDTQYTFANEPAAKGAGIGVDDMMGKTMASVMGPIRANAFAEVNKEVLADFKKMEKIHTFEEGEDLQVIRSSHIPLQGDRDYPPGVLMILDDITELTREKRRSEAMLRQLINTLVSVVDRRDPYSAHHSGRVAEVSKCIATEMSLEPEEVRCVDIAGSLMSLGKIFIPPHVLTKTDNLTASERDMLARAYLVSADLLEGVPFEGPVVESIQQMGEKWDGSGPLGLSGEQTMRTARILHVANAFVGMVSARAYRAAMTFEKASAILLSEAGEKVDRKAVSALINYLENRGGSDEWAHFREPPQDDPSGGPSGGDLPPPPPSAAPTPTPKPEAKAEEPPKKRRRVATIIQEPEPEPAPAPVPGAEPPAAPKSSSGPKISLGAPRSSQAKKPPTSTAGKSGPAKSGPKIGLGKATTGTQPPAKPAVAPPAKKKPAIALGATKKPQATTPNTQAPAQQAPAKQAPAKPTTAKQAPAKRVLQPKPAPKIGVGPAKVSRPAEPGPQGQVEGRAKGKNKLIAKLKKKV
ncbi:MAG: HD domain-containing phosphohydrolase [Magnetovibrionaceae bacterium]